VTLDILELPSKFNAYEERWRDRNERMDLMTRVVKGDWQNIPSLPDNEEAENRSPNMIQVALEDTAEAAALIPTVRVGASKKTQEAIKRAAAMEQMAVAYLDASQIELLTIRSMMDLAGHGVISWVVVKNEETGSPVIEWRNPRTCYPAMGHHTFDAAREVMFARDLYVKDLPPEWQVKFAEMFKLVHPKQHVDVWVDHKITLVEHYDDTETVIAGMYQTMTSGMTGRAGATYQPVELERFPTPGGISPVVVKHRLTFDNEPRGQFDQVVNVMTAHIRLMAMVLDYADQAVYSDVWVKDLIGNMAWGGGSYIQLGPQGQIGRVPPAVTELSVFREMEQLLEHIHLGGRWPKVRPGEVDQAIASAKFIEASAGMMNTVIRTYHLIMKGALQQALRICFKIDKAAGGSRTVSGILRNQQFMIERDASDIDESAKVRVEYGLGLGRDPAQSMVLAIQAHQAGFISREFVQENLEGITDVELERQRIDIQQLRDMALAQLLQGLEAKTIPPSALVDIAQARQRGDEIFEIFKKYVVQPQEEQQATALTSGLTGEQMQPGMGPMPVPPAPPPEELMAGLFGGPPESIGRLSTPLPGGGFAGSQVTSGP
jgi:hypothetical protein